jgi:hypothetical protein
MRLAAILIAAFLLIASAAEAKEITEAKACGSDGCVTTRDPAVLQGLMNGGPPTVPPRTDGPVIRLRSTVTEPGQGVVDHFRSWWMPSQRLLVSEDGTWMRLPTSAQNGLERAAGDLTPFPASKMGLTSTTTPAATPAAAPPADGDGDGTAWLLLLLPAGALALAGVLELRRRHPHGDLPVKQGV